MTSDASTSAVPDDANVGVGDDAAMRELEARTKAHDDALSRQRPGRTEVLKICSWNVQLLPGVCSGQGGRRPDLDARAVKLAENILRVSRVNTIDVLCLQEVWTPRSLSTLCEALRQEFPFIFMPNAHSGLFVASKYSIVCSHFSPFPAAKGMERIFFTKGVCTTFLRLTSPETTRTRVAVVMNTHLQSDYWSCGRATRLKQLKHIKRTMQRAVQECRGNGYDIDRIILAGDLNIAAGGDEYRQAMAVFPSSIDLMAPPRDLSSSWRAKILANIEEDRIEETDWSFRYTFPVAYWRHVWCPCFGSSRYVDAQPRAMIDYILDLTPMIRAGVPPHRKHVDSGYVHHQMCRDAKGEALSDHYPICCCSSVFHFNDREYTS